MISSLTTGKDTLTGDDLNNTYTAGVVQNSFGEQTNELATGDSINGSGGTDTLKAYVQMASALNNVPASSIRPTTVDIENAEFTALTVDNSNSPAAQSETVTIDAYQMWGLDRLHSKDSNASLVIENVNTLRDDGIYANRRLTKDMTIRMDHSGNGEQVDDASDLTVLFDQNYLISEGDVNSGATMTIELMDMDSALSGGDPLLDNPYGRITFTMGTQTKVLDWSVDNASANTYDQLLTAIQNAITRAGRTDPLFKQLTASITRNGFTANDTDGEPGGSAIGDTIVITNSGPEVLDAVSMTATGVAPAGKDFHTNFGDTPPNTDGSLITVNVELEKVGRGADGGDLTIGGMSTPFGALDNEYVEGMQFKSIEQFNVTVSGDASQWSSLASLQSTNNRLEVVNVVSAARSQADLIIGNTETEEQLERSERTINQIAPRLDDVSSLKNAALKDVRVFDSTAFANDIELHAYISDEVQAKYLDEIDQTDDAIADNVNFNYNFGNGDDLFNLNVDKSNLVLDNSSVSEDFVMTINMGEGNNHFQGQIGNGLYEFEWYENLVVNAEADDTPTQLRVTTGSGNDIIEAWGSGRWNIDAGSGNDAIYSDNSGTSDSLFNEGRATWVLNVARDSNGFALDNIDNLVSDGIENNGAFFRSFVSVNFAGYTSAEVQITNFNSTDTDLNNAIKRAISNDVHLSKLLIAEDGPAGTLVIRSLVDGVFSDGDFNFTLRAPSNTTELGALSSGQIASFNRANGTNHSTAAQILAEIQGDVAAFNNDSADNTDPLDDGDYVVTLASIEGSEADEGSETLSGFNSSAVTSNVIEAGNGLDTVSLSTTIISDVETLNVADAEDYTGNTVEDLVVNATNADITFDEDDLIITNFGALITTESTSTVEVRANVIFADIGNQTISGSGGDDVISGGAGADSLTGGLGADTYLYLVSGESTLANMDNVSDFNVLDDAISFDTSSDSDDTNDAAVAGNVENEFQDGMATGNLATAISASASLSDALTTFLAAASFDNNDVAGFVYGTNTYIVHADGDGQAGNIVTLTGVTITSILEVDNTDEFGFGIAI